MGDTLPKFTAAAVQAAPVFMDRDATIEKACELIAEAGNAGAKLIVFPETWVPMYPFWHTTQNVFGSVIRGAVEELGGDPSAATNKLAQAAKQAGAYVVIGINERDTASRGTLYNTLLYLAPTGEVMHRHRKLMPTFTERTIWGFGDGAIWRSWDAELGRLGGLICWEHQMTLVKYALYAQGEQVHCAYGPRTATRTTTSISARDSTRSKERASWYPPAASCRRGAPKEIAGACSGERWHVQSSSRTAGIAGPIFDKEEILYAEIDLEVAIREKHARDIAGHYARPDVLQLVVNPRRKPVATFVEHRGSRKSRCSRRSPRSSSTAWRRSARTSAA